jgi:glycosyltransferase involved in cell wall biosynthesis
MKVVVVMPAYNAEKTLKLTYDELPKGSYDEIILVDDKSSDRTVEIAHQLGIKTIVHERNKGYGANQKTCYTEALKDNADIVIMLHPDYQYDGRFVPYLVGPIRDGLYDIMLGSRIRSRREALRSGMPLYKYLGNRFLTFVENIVLGENLSEYHTGFRAYSREVLETLPWRLNSDDFVFDQQILIEAVYFGFKIGEIYTPARYFPEASSINFFRSVIYGLSTLWYLFRYILHVLGIVKCKLFIKPS